MPETPRETAGAVRAAHVAFFFPTEWTRVTDRLVPALERADRSLGALQLLVIVPDDAAALPLARELATRDAALGLRIVPATSAGRAQRVLRVAPAQVVVGSPSALVGLLRGSSLKLADVTTIALTAAEGIGAENDDLAALLAEAPKDARRILTAAEPTAEIEALLERYLHKARRVIEDQEVEEEAAPAPAPDPDAPVEAPLPHIPVRYAVVAGESPLDALAGVLDTIDPPSAAIVVGDARTEEAAGQVLHALGYSDTGGLVQVTRAEVASHTALVVCVGVPSAVAWKAIIAARPAQVVALTIARALPALRRVVGDSPLTPFGAKGTMAKAKVAEERMRAEVRSVLGDGFPAREVLALEPLLVEFDGLEVAAAALRLLERERGERELIVAKAVQAAVKTAEEKARGDDRGGRGAPRSFGPRGDRPPRSFPPRDGAPRGDRPPRSFAPREDRPPRSFAPRDGASRDDRPPRSFAPRDGARDGAPRGDRPPRSGPPRSAGGDRPPRSYPPRDGGARGGAPRGRPRRED
ncbi:MAG: DEAD/DEAH box helicase [Gemmatimonadaceae bacterium]|nr:DEAD/DEAH box helicase [Gemmatimonadaceae bacterium]